MRNKLENVTLRGFKTIQALEGFAPCNLTALIGPNGAGKSNFISFFRMMSWALADPDNLPLYVGQQGGASTLLHNGPAETREIEAKLTIRTEGGDNQYAFRLVFAAGDTLIFADEKYRYSSTSKAWCRTLARDRRRTPRARTPCGRRPARNRPRHSGPPSEDRRVSISQHVRNRSHPQQVARK